MVRKLNLLFLFLISFAAVAQNQQDSLWIRENYTKIEVMVPMRDGVSLFTSVYAPKDNSEKHPILFTRTPYSCSPYGKDQWRAFWNRYERYYMREGYIIVTQDVRGRYMSEGKFVDVRPFNKDKKSATDIDEASDTYDAIDWMVKNIPANNGNVGVKGISYPGFYSTMAAYSRHPALKAVSPQAPMTDQYMGDDEHHNGVFFAMDNFFFYSGFGKPRPVPTTKGSSGYKLPTQDRYQFFLDTKTIRNLTNLLKDSVAFWKEIIKHPDYDAFWQAMDTRNFVTQIPDALPTLIVGGLFDAEDCYGAWRLYEAIEKKAHNDNKLVMGPWYHGQWASNDGSKLGPVKFESNTALYYQNQIEIPFFDHYLKDKGTYALPEATVFFSGENKWRTFDHWPPTSSKLTPLYLQSGQKLSWQVPAGKSSFSEYTSDPEKPVPYAKNAESSRYNHYMVDDQRFASRRTDVLTFQTEVLTDDISLAGMLTAELFSAVNTTDVDFVVKLIDVFPDKSGDVAMDSYQMLVRGEIMRARYRNSFEKPEPLAPGKVEKVRFDLPDVAHTFKKGHRIMVHVQSSWFPLAERSPQKFINIFEAGEGDFQKATIRIFHDAAHSSRILLPVMTK